MSAFVLAGGASSRMGTDKVWLAVGGLTMLDRALQLLKEISPAPRIVVAKSNASHPDLAAYAPIVQDLQTGCGPLSGIEAGLLASHSDLSIFIPVDLPLLPARFLKILIERSAHTGAVATIARVLGQVQPLCAVYHRALLPAITNSLAAGDYKVMRVVHQAAALLSERIDIFNLETVTTAGATFDGWPIPASRAFLNCNSPADVSRIEFYSWLHPNASEQAT